MAQPETPEIKTEAPGTVSAIRLGISKGSAFTAWFEAQHGKRPTTTCGKSDRELEELVEAGRRAKCVRDAQREWDARAESALYAWQAKVKGDARRMRKVKPCCAWRTR